jgi:hypothetical protein
VLRSASFIHFTYVIRHEVWEYLVRALKQLLPISSNDEGFLIRLSLLFCRIRRLGETATRTTRFSF